ncbi:von Willebrand factor type A domain-containing protein [Mangrovivirga sp. M17]|uniref:von Willebrand factor type A domain-containing protein n=1 Tax=Mangrovivirga halotolerans TaxID=2993936 RepID=A0ABT3RPE1_9BACT|nr:von Willebrand factor type A domain-containing protein [Mangrovivirga halotolerans]MCX2743491.1 von Willebrand factor type A domain-containing protein [Mangrovivirga halotolerans]
MKRIFPILSAVIFLLAFNIENPHKVTGVVTDENGQGIPGVNVVEKGTTNGTVTDIYGAYELTISGKHSVLTFSSVGYKTQEVKVKGKNEIDITLKQDGTKLQEVVTTGMAEEELDMEISQPKNKSVIRIRGVASGINPQQSHVVQHDSYTNYNTEDYAVINENQFHKPSDQPLSTFSIDVDAASYSNVRRYLNNGLKPPTDAVRIEEMINYFNYDYKEPSNEHPFSINTEIADCPWQEGHYLLHVGLQGKKIPKENIPASNLVFLIDVSGSMGSPNKLPLLKSAFKMLVEELRPEDRVGIVVYAGAAGMVLPSTSGDKKADIIQALDNLNAGGSTAGGAGIKLAYKIAEEHFIEEGNNRIILATDGDFNVGQSSNGYLEDLIVEKRKSGVFLTTLGFGMGNYKDDKMEILADKGNGNYAYIDDISEARKVFVNEFGGTMFTIAKDVKIQIEFNPEKVAGYRLIGYENRKLNAEDFNDDKKDAGELGSGHSVTAIYQVIPIGGPSAGFLKSVDDLKYQKDKSKGKKYSDEWATVKFRYKKPNGSKSILMTEIINNTPSDFHETSDDFRFSAAVASFGLWLRSSDFMGESNPEMVVEIAKESLGNDEFGYRHEFLKMVKSSKYMAKMD